MIFLKKPLLIILFLGFILRLSLLFIDFGFDVNNHISWAQDMISRGLSGFYETSSREVFGHAYPNYPPFSLFIFFPLPALYKIIHEIFWQINLAILIFPSNIVPFLETRHALAAVFKLPGVLGDMALAYILYLFTKRIYPHKKKLQLLTPILILFHPTVFYNSSLWGQIDGLPILFTLVATYLLIYSKRPLLSVFTMMSAILIKPQALIFLPVYILLIYKNFQLQERFLLSLFAISIFFLSFVPFYKSGNFLSFPFDKYYHDILQAQSLSSVSNAAYTAWTINPYLLHTQDSTQIIFTLTYQIIGLIITGVLSLFILKRMLTKKLDAKNILFSMSLMAYTAFLFMTRMHERYLLLMVPFLLVPALKNKTLFKLWIILSIVSFINLYKSFAVPGIAGGQEFLSSNPIVIIFSIINIAVYILLMKNFNVSKHH